MGSIILSFLFVPTMGDKSLNAILNITKGIRGWFFAVAFVCIGLDMKFKGLARIGRGRPLLVFLAAQVFNVLLTLLLAYALFGGTFSSSPV